jgi:Flp pilus assembly protein TadD
VLDANPDEVFALHELGFTYFTKKDYENALATARQGARYRCPQLPQFHMLIGNVLDEMGDSESAKAHGRPSQKRRQARFGGYRSQHVAGCEKRMRAISIP